jgi:putative GTP pyrophosphokinase
MLTRSQVKNAGKILKERDLHSDEEIAEAENALTYWRTIHGKVISDFYKIVLSEVEKINKEAYVVKRLKRSPSIIGKLKRNPNTQLTTMQDIAGIRAIMKNLNEVELLRESLKKYAQIHEFKAYDNYITNPKESGYRSIHLIYRYKDEGNLETNGLLIEIQIRSSLQHSWATAVETFSTFKGANLKFGEGKKNWLDCFALISSAFAYLEGTPRVPGYTLLSQKETFKKAINEYNCNQIEPNLSGFTIAVEAISKKKEKEGAYHILKLDIEKRILKITNYSSDKFEQANKDYTELERQYTDNNAFQVVLVSSDSINELKEGFPNYFLDTKAFIMNMEQIRGEVL